MTKEEKNVFRDANFGDKFLTRNGKVMIYQKQTREDVYCLFDEESDCVIEYRSNGDVIYEYTGNAEPQEDDIVKKYVQPSILSNIEEAAEEYALDVKAKPFGNLVKEAFKSGAKWLSKQGETIKTLVYRDEDDALFIEAFVDDVKFKMGDIVLIQIRKENRE